MPRQNARNLNPMIMENVHGQGYQSLKAFSDAKDIPYVTLLRYADSDEPHAHLKGLVKTAEALGMPLEEFVQLLVSK